MLPHLIPFRWLRRAPILAVFVLGGCVLAPKEAKREQDRVDAAAGHYVRPAEQRELPELPPAPGWRDVLRRAFYANGELEAAYWEWAMSVSRIRQAGSYPNGPVQLGFDRMFGGESMKAWDRTTISAQFEPMLMFPSKPYQSAKVAWRDAQAAGERFAAAKFALQRQVLNSWVDYALMAEQIRIQQENVSLLRLLNETAAGRVQAGGSQQDLLRTDVEYRLAENEARSMGSRLPQMRAMLNAMLGRDPEAPLEPPQRLPEPRPLPDDATVLSIGVGANPELAALARQVQGRHDALERARMEYIPDFSPTFSFTGSVSQMAGLMIGLPTELPRIRGMIKEARADLRRTEAMARQTKLDRAAEYVAALYALRNSERQAELFESRILPSARRVLDNARQSYTAGTGLYLDLIEAQRTLLDVRLMIAEARAAREKSLADLEALAGVDMETVGRATTRPASQPSTQP